MAWKDDLVTAYRDHGLKVSLPNYAWRNFGVGDWLYGMPQAILNHHFVIKYSSPDSAAVSMLTKGYDTGSYWLAPPVSNNYLGKAGMIYMIGARVAQHGGRGIREVLERAMQDLPCRGDAWKSDDYSSVSMSMWGTECHHPGDNTPMPDVQYDALIKKNAAECQVFGFSANRVIQHLESTQRKQDINRAAVNAPALRQRVAVVLKGGKPPVIPTPVKPISIPDLTLLREDFEVYNTYQVAKGNAVYYAIPGLMAPFVSAEEYNVCVSKGAAKKATVVSQRELDVLKNFYNRTDHGNNNPK